MEVRFPKEGVFIFTNKAKQKASQRTQHRESSFLEERFGFSRDNGASLFDYPNSDPKSD